MFNQVWQNLRSKFTMIADDQLFQDGENDGSLIILNKNGKSTTKKIEGKEKSGMNLNRYKNFIKNIYFSEELGQLVLLKSYEASNKSEQIFFMSTKASENYEYHEL